MFHTLSQCTYSAVHLIDDSFVDHGRPVSVEVNEAAFRRCIQQAGLELPLSEAQDSAASQLLQPLNPGANNTRRGSHRCESIRLVCRNDLKSNVSQKAFWSDANNESDAKNGYPHNETWRAATCLGVSRCPANDWSRLQKGVHDLGALSGRDVAGSDLITSTSAFAVADLLEGSHGGFAVITDEKNENLLKTYTPRQRKLHASLEPADTLTEAVLQEALIVRDQLLSGFSDLERRYAVKQMFKDFVVELTRGAYFTQLATGGTYIKLHCQLTENLDALTVDPNTGERIEFPLLDVLKIYEVTKERRWDNMNEAVTAERCSLGEQRFSRHTQSVRSTSCSSKVPPLDFRWLLRDLDHLVVLQFRIRRLPFVFKNEFEANRFKLCFDLLVRYVGQRAKTHQQGFYHLRQQLLDHSFDWFSFFRRESNQRGLEGQYAEVQKTCYFPSSSFPCHSYRSCCCDSTQNRSMDNGESSAHNVLESSSLTPQPHCHRQEQFNLTQPRERQLDQQTNVFNCSHAPYNSTADEPTQGGSNDLHTKYAATAHGAPVYGNPDMCHRFIRSTDYHSSFYLNSQEMEYSSTNASVSTSSYPMGSDFNLNGNATPSTSIISSTSPLPQSRCTTLMPPSFHTPLVSERSCCSSFEHCHERHSFTAATSCRNSVTSKHSQPPITALTSIASRYDASPISDVSNDSDYSFSVDMPVCTMKPVRHRTCDVKLPSRTYNALASSVKTDYAPAAGKMDSGKHCYTSCELHLPQTPVTSGSCTPQRANTEDADSVIFEEIAIEVTESKR